MTFTINKNKNTLQGILLSARIMIGEKLKILREAKELRQYELAEIIGISQKSICAIEKRDDIFLSSLKQYVEALGGNLKIYVEFKKEEKIYDLSGAVK